MDPLAPPVVAVVVTRDPGPWFEEALASFGSQDYPNLSVLVIDAASQVDPTPRVAEVLPTAFVRRLEHNSGFGSSANLALELVEGASHLVLCHDDVAPDPDAVRLLVEEAFRSNAGMVTPKLVSWSDRRRLLQVGMGADKAGAPAGRVEAGELDQEQHDAVRDVFVAPGALTLVRADLFEAVGGFDPSIFLFGEDLDLSWRVQVAGARIVVAPAAVVRHREAALQGERSFDWPGPGERPAAAIESLQRRHELRAVLKAYGGWHLARVVPQVALFALVELIADTFTGRRRNAAAVAGAWRWNLRRAAGLREARREVAAHRRWPDHEVRRLQSPGSARLSAFVASQIARGERSLQRAGRRRTIVAGGQVRTRLPLVVWLVVAAVLLVGSRHLFGGPLPLVGQLAPYPGWSSFLHQFAGGWRHTGVGAASPAPPAFLLLGLGGMVLLGGMGLLQIVLVLGTLPLAAVGAWRLARPLGSTRARMVVAVVYLAVPLWYDGMAAGRWDALLVYATAPWIISRLLGAMGLEPFHDGGVRREGRELLWRSLGLGVVVALLTALVPEGALVTLVATATLASGALLTRRPDAARRAVLVGVGSVVVAFVLCFPWSLDFFHPGAQASAFSGLVPAPSGGLGALLRFQTGSLGNGPVGWAFVAAAFLPVAIGRGWRFGLALRLWALALGSWGLAWVSIRGWLGPAGPPPDLLLPAAAVAVAMLAGLGLAAFEIDLPGYRFGWRQSLAGALGAFLALAALPVVASSAGGRWNLPAQGFEQSLGWIAPSSTRGAFRVLWLGDARALPLSGWSAGSGLAYATSESGLPDATDLWPTSDPGSAGLLATFLQQARLGRTARLGHLVAPFGVRYIVLVRGAAPLLAGQIIPPTPHPPADLQEALLSQTDLRHIDSDPSTLVLQNAAWAPERALLDPSAAAASRGGPTAALFTGLAGSRPVLPGSRSSLQFTGTVHAGTLSVALPFSSGWTLTTSRDQVLSSRPSFGWATAYRVPARTEATLSFETSGLRGVAITVEIVLWALAAALLIRGRAGRWSTWAEGRSRRHRRGARINGDGVRGEPRTPPPTRSDTAPAASPGSSGAASRAARHVRATSETT